MGAPLFITAEAQISEADEILLDNVRPAHWTNPEPAGRYDLVVVGAGTAGLVAAAGGAGLGARVALMERDRLGGDCLNFGCVPSKGVIRAARSWHAARESAARFGGPPATGAGDLGTAFERMRRLRAEGLLGDIFSLVRAQARPPCSAQHLSEVRVHHRFQHTWLAGANRLGRVRPVQVWCHSGSRLRSSHPFPTARTSRRTSATGAGVRNRSL